MGWLTYQKFNPGIIVWVYFFLFLFDSGSIDGNNQLVIKGRFQQKQIENVLRRYISK